MKNVIYYFTLLLMIGFVPGRLDSQILTDSALSARVSRIEDAVRKSEEKLETLNERKELDLRELKVTMTELESEIRNNVIFIILGFLGSIAVCIGIVKIFQLKIKKHLDSKVTAELEARVNKLIDINLPPKFNALFKIKIEEYFTTQKEFLETAIGEGRDLKDFREGKKILVYCEDDQDREKMREIFSVIYGFKNVETKVPNDVERITDDKYDLVIIDRERKEAGKTYNVLNDGFIQQTVLNTKGAIFLYYGTRAPMLDSQNLNFSFANTPFTLYARVLEVFKYQKAVAHSK